MVGAGRDFAGRRPGRRRAAASRRSIRDCRGAGFAQPGVARACPPGAEQLGPRDGNLVNRGQRTRVAAFSGRESRRLHAGAGGSSSTGFGLRRLGAVRLLLLLGPGDMARTGAGRPGSGSGNSNGSSADFLLSSSIRLRMCWLRRQLFLGRRVGQPPVLPVPRPIPIPGKRVQHGHDRVDVEKIDRRDPKIVLKSTPPRRCPARRARSAR